MHLLALELIFAAEAGESACTLKNQRLKVTQLEKTRFIKVNELKLSEVELF